MFVSIILRSDKTTVSGATGNNEYWPIYMSIGNIHNSTQQAHQNGMYCTSWFSYVSFGIKYLLISNDLAASQETRCWLPQIPEVLLTTISYNTHENIWAVQAFDVEARGCALCWWSFLPSHIWDWLLYCRLPWAMPALCYHSRLVSEYGILIYLSKLQLYWWNSTSVPSRTRLQPVDQRWFKSFDEGLEFASVNFHLLNHFFRYIYLLLKAMCQIKWCAHFVH